MPHRRYTETPARARSETHYLLLYCCRLTTAVRLVPLLLLLKLPCVRNITRILKNSRARRVQTSNLFFFFLLCHVHVPRESSRPDSLWEFRGYTAKRETRVFDYSIFYIRHVIIIYRGNRCFIKN